MTEGSIPTEVIKGVQEEFGRKPEGEKAKWNVRFNNIADRLQEAINAQTGSYKVLHRGLSYRGENNPVLGVGKAAVRGLGGVAWGMSTVELSVLKVLVDLGAKATGGRRSPIASTASK